MAKSSRFRGSQAASKGFPGGLWKKEGMSVIPAKRISVKRMIYNEMLHFGKLIYMNILCSGGPAHGSSARSVRPAHGSHMM